MEALILYVSLAAFGGSRHTLLDASVYWAGPPPPAILGWGRDENHA